jgi:hypothetical protein
VPLTNNTFVANMGNIRIPGNSQRIGDSELILSNIVYHGTVLGRERWCAELDGQLTAPLMESLAPPGDICIGIALTEGADLPTAMLSTGTTYIGYANEEHHCP